MLVGEVELLRASIDCNEAHVCELGTTGHAALFSAALGNNIECLRMLMDARAQINQRSANGLDALTAAAWAGHDQVIALLLECGECDLMSTVPRSGHMTALMAAAEQGHSLVLSQLLNAHAAPAQVDSKGS